MVLVVSTVDDPVVVAKSCAVWAALLTAADAVSVEVSEVPVLVSVLPVVAAVVPDVAVDATKVIPLDDPVVVDPADRLLDEIAALSEVAAAPSAPNSPELAVVAEGSEPAVTLKSSVPSLEISHGAPAAGVPPSRLTPIT